MIQKPKIWFGISLLTVVVSLVIVGAVRPLWGIDFVGGSLMEIGSGPEAVAPIRQLLQAEFGLETTVQTTPDNTLIIRTSPLTEEQHQNILSRLEDQGLLSGEELRFESIGPVIGQELRQRSWKAIGLVVLVMIAYLSYTFRGTRGLISPWKFGVAATYALLHDVLVVLALFVILGRIMGVAIDTLFVTAMLAILGYSVNDTIVFFDRVRAEWVARRTPNLLLLIDEAAKATVVRSLNMSLTTLITLGSLLVFGGTTIRWFIVALVAGIIAGTFSSIFVAPPFLYLLTKRR